MIKQNSIKKTTNNNILPIFINSTRQNTYCNSDNVIAFMGYENMLKKVLIQEHKRSKSPKKEKKQANICRYTCQITNFEVSLLLLGLLILFFTGRNEKKKRIKAFKIAPSLLLQTSNISVLTVGSTQNNVPAA